MKHVVNQLFLKKSSVLPFASLAEPLRILPRTSSTPISTVLILLDGITYFETSLFQAQLSRGETGGLCQDRIKMLEIEEIWYVFSGCVFDCLRAEGAHRLPCTSS